MCITCFAEYILYLISRLAREVVVIKKTGKKSYSFSFLTVSL